MPASISFYVQPRRDGSVEPQALMLDEAGLGAALRAFPPRSLPRMAERDLHEAPCGAGASTIAVDPFGTVFPCHSLRLAAGSLRDQGLRQIWDRSPVLGRLRRLRVGDLHDCPGCPWRRSCNRCTGFAVGEGLALEAHCTTDCTLARLLG